MALGTARGWGGLFATTLAICILAPLAMAVDQNPTTAPVTQPALRRPVPDKLSQAAATRALRELFKPYPPPSGDEKRKLARKLLDRVTAAGSDDDPATQFVLLHASAELAATAGEFHLAARAIDQMSKRFAIDAVAERLDVLNEATTAPLPAMDAVDGAQAALTQAAGSLRDCDFATAERAATIGEALARRAEDPQLRHAAETMAADARRGQTASAAAARADAQRRADPLDADACLAAGRYRCFWRGDWAGGLPLLAVGSDELMKSLAAADLAAPADAQAQLALADRWLALAANESGTPQSQIRAHAATCLQTALRQLTGLRKTLAERRLAEITDAARAAADLLTSRELALARRLNDPAHWKVQAGAWHNTPGKLHGEGDSSIRFDMPIPRDIAFSFRVNVLDGMRPRMIFKGTGMTFGNEGFTRQLFPFGAQVAGHPQAIHYRHNEPHLLSFRLSADHFQIDVDGKPTFTGTYQRAADEPIQLEFRAGDDWSPGTTEFYGFEVQSLGRAAAE